MIEVSTDPDRLDLAVIHAFLRDSYWAKDIPLAVVERAVRGSICFGAYDDRAQVGFARVVTDRATFAYLADVDLRAQQSPCRRLLRESAEARDGR